MLLRVQKVVVVFILASITAIVLVNIVLYLQRQADYRTFVAKVQANMPGYQLTPKIMGRDFEIAKNFIVHTFPGRNGDDTTAEQAREFIALFDELGLPRVSLIFSQSFPIANMTVFPHWEDFTWEMDFPGCSPEQCVNLMDDAKFSQVDVSTFEAYSTSPKDIVLVTSRIRGHLFWATVTVDVNPAGQITAYRVTTHHEYRDYFEGLEASLSDPGGMIVHRDLASVNLTLGVALFLGNRKWHRV